MRHRHLTAILGTAAVLVLLVALPCIVSASTISPVGSPNGQSSGCQPGGLFGSVAPISHALVGILYPDPETGADCILGEGGTLPGDVLNVWLYTPNAIDNDTVNIGVEEYHWGSHTVDYPGPNGTVTAITEAFPENVSWSNATIAAQAGEFQQFDLGVPPVYTTPSGAWNLTVTILGLVLSYLIATPGTALPLAVTLGGLIGWLALMSPAAVITFIGGFGPGQLVVHRLRYVSTGLYAIAIAGLLSAAIVIGIVVKFTGFLYWLGTVGILGLALLLLVPLFCWGTAFWITVRGKRVKARLIRSPIAKAKNGEPVAGLTAVRVYGGGDTGHPEELVEGLGVGGPGAAWHRLLGLRIFWKTDRIARDPRLVYYEWTKGRLDIEGEYAAWPGKGGQVLDFSVHLPETVWFPWRKSVRARYDPPASPEQGSAPGANGSGLAAPPEDGVRDPALWAHRGFFLGFRHGEASVSALGTPDYVGPDQYIRGVAPAAEFGREAARRGKLLLMLHERIDTEAEERAHELVAVHDRLQVFPDSPEAMEGLREFSTRSMGTIFDEKAFMERLAERGSQRPDWRPAGASKYSSSVVDVHSEALDPRPPETRGKATRPAGG